MKTLFIAYTVLSFLLIFLFSKFSYNFNLVDNPNERKIHTKPVANTGGLIISFLILLAIIFNPYEIEEINTIISISLLISFIGFIDDKYNLNIGGKLSLQIIPVFYLISFHNLFLIDIGNYEYFTLNLGTFGIPFTLFCILFLINAFNYFDGIDGCLSTCVISSLLILYFLISDQNIKVYLIILLIPILIFLLFNFSLLKLPKLFLGDSGSLLLGFIISFYIIFIANKNLIHPILIAWLIVIFVYEFISINLIRLKAGKGLFIAGKDHLHHILLKKTKSIFNTNLIMFSLNIALFFAGYLSFLFINPITSLILYIVLFVLFFMYRNKYK